MAVTWYFGTVDDIESAWNIVIYAARYLLQVADETRTPQCRKLLNDLEEIVSYSDETSAAIYDDQDAVKKWLDEVIDMVKCVRRYILETKSECLNT